MKAPAIAPAAIANVEGTSAEKDMTRRDMTREDKMILDKVRHDSTKQDKPRHQPCVVCLMCLRPGAAATSTFKKHADKERDGRPHKPHK